MSGFKRLILGFILPVVLLLPAASQARGRRGFWGGPGFSAARWRGGYWFHGAYVGRAGWWWIVGPYWYYYPAPIYPYPQVDAEPVYSVQVANVPPPPAESAPPPAPTNVVAGTNGSGKAFSYYCEKSKAYYPNVKVCADGWIATPVHAPN